MIDIVTIPEAAIYHNVSEGTVLNAVKAGRIKGRQAGGTHSRWMLVAQSVRDWEPNIEQSRAQRTAAAVRAGSKHPALASLTRVRVPAPDASAVVAWHFGPDILVAVAELRADVARLADQITPVVEALK